jgi:hypothetical protein
MHKLLVTDFFYGDYIVPLDGPYLLDFGGSTTPVSYVSMRGRV